MSMYDLLNKMRLGDEEEVIIDNVLGTELIMSMSELYFTSRDYFLPSPENKIVVSPLNEYENSLKVEAKDEKYFSKNRETVFYKFSVLELLKKYRVPFFFSNNDPKISFIQEVCTKSQMDKIDFSFSSFELSFPFIYIEYLENKKKYFYLSDRRVLIYKEKI